MSTRTRTTTMRRLTTFARNQLQRPPFQRARNEAAGRLKDISHRLEGLAYRVADRRPDPDVDDTVLAQRIRSQLGPLERRLDVPRLNITVHEHIVELRGVVGTRRQAETLIRAIQGISGVDGVLSFLHVGYGPGDTTPSQGRRHQPPSQAWLDLMGSVRELGEEERTAAALATAIVATLLDVLPPSERDHMRVHLPTDVRNRVDNLVRIGKPPRPTTTDEFVTSVTDVFAVPRGTAEMATRQVLATLQDLVPEETADVAAVLPRGLKELWRTPLPT